MKWEDFYRNLDGHNLFDLPLAHQILAKPKPQVVQQLKRWVGAGRLMSLRRGMYALPPVYQKRSLSPLRVANELYRPSYLGGVWALGFYGLIPERVVRITSVTTRVTRAFANALGEFAYSNIRKDLFRNFSRREVEGNPVWIAEPEKALLDYWHLEPGAWDTARMEEMRFQGFEAIDGKKLREYAAGYPPRVLKAVSAWEKIVEGEGLS